MTKAFIQTFGCQMNEHDSRRMKDILQKQGYQMTQNPEEAGLILINTCSVRENPENKVYSMLGRLAMRKEKEPSLILGVAGCVAQQDGEKILERQPAVDLVFGTDNIFRLPEMLEKVKEGHRAINTTWLPRERKVQNFIPEQELLSGQVENAQAILAITKGCDNFCTYCIVPHTRGRLVSRELGNILTEAQDLVAKGAKEIMLVGQNVNSYQAGGQDFYQLLDQVSRIEGLKRIRFTSPHPNDWNDALTDLMAERPNIARSLHLPYQSGSDAVLTRMRRDHNQADYLKKVEYLKAKIPGLCLSADIIVGFPGETEEDFQETMKVLEEVRFAQVYAFKYSPRPGTKAEQWEDDIPTPIKEERLAILLERQAQIQQEILDSFLGSQQEVLLDKPHPKEPDVLFGRCSGNVSVSVAGNHQIGDWVEVKITGKRTYSLVGEGLSDPFRE